MTRAEAAPMAPASRRSEKFTRPASASRSLDRFMLRPRAYREKARSARSRPTKRTTIS